MPYHRRFFVATCFFASLVSQCGVRAANTPGVFSRASAFSRGYISNQKPELPDPCYDSAGRPIALGAYYFSNGRCAPGDADAVTAFKAQTGRTPAVWMIYQSWIGWSNFPAAQAQRARSLGSTLMVTWEPWAGQDDARNWNCQDVVSGRFDRFIRLYARSVKDAGVPVMMRFAHEMNGDWYPWGTAYNGFCRRNNNNSPAMFVAMWKHVVSLFRTEGATNAKWVWSPNIVYTNNYNDQAQQERDLFSLYPGDSWVDWVGASVYNDGARRPWRSFSALFDSTYRVLTLLSPKPLMIAELGVTEQGAPFGQTKAAWLQQALLNDIPNRYNRVRCVTYFCRDKSGTGESNYRFDSSPASLAAFRLAANSPLYSEKNLN